MNFSINVYQEVRFDSPAIEKRCDFFHLPGLTCMHVSMHVIIEPQVPAADLLSELWAQVHRSVVSQTQRMTRSKQW